MARPSVARGKLLELVATLSPYLIGMKPAWARIARRGCSWRTERLMAPKFVVPYHLPGKRGKNNGPMRLAKQCPARQLYGTGIRLSLHA